MRSTCPTELRLLDLIAPVTFGNNSADCKTLHFVILPPIPSSPRSVPASPQPILTVAAQVARTQNVSPSHVL